MPGNRYEEGSGRGAVYDFFYKMFGGIDDGLEDSSHNLKRVDHIDDLNINNDEIDYGPSPELAVEKYAERQAARVAVSQGDEYRHSVLDVVGSEVFSRRGEMAGNIHDILVHKETGKARAIVVNEDDSRYERDLTALSFKRVQRQQDDGDVLVTVTEEKIEDAPDFTYSSLEDTNYISLRHLRDGQLLDYEGKVAGQIDAVIYQNAEAQNIFFTLRPVLAQHGISKFQMSFEDINIIESPDGLDIKLTKEQTEKLAETMFENSPQ